MAFNAYAHCVHDFTKLLVWQKAVTLAVSLEKAFPPRVRHAIPGLRNQILRSAASISANIAEGCGKASSDEFVRFLTIALGSANELKSHLVLARKADMLTEQEYACLERDRAEVGKMLWGLMKATRARGDR